MITSNPGQYIQLRTLIKLWRICVKTWDEVCHTKQSHVQRPSIFPTD